MGTIEKNVSRWEPMKKCVSVGTIVGPIHVSKYFSRIRRDSLCSSKTFVCLWNDANVDRVRLENSIVIRDETNEDDCFPINLYDSSSSSILINYFEISLKFKIESSSDGLHLIILVFLTFKYNPIFRSSSINFVVMTSSSCNDFA